MDNLRLANGDLWPMPIVLDISEKEVETLGLKEGSRLALLDGRDDAALAILTSEFHATFLQSLPRLLMRKFGFS